MQHLAAADVVVDEIVALEVGLAARSSDLAGGDVEVFGILERRARMPLRKLT